VHGLRFIDGHALAPAGALRTWLQLLPSSPLPVLAVKPSCLVSLIARAIVAVMFQGGQQDAAIAAVTRERAAVLKYYLRHDRLITLLAAYLVRFPFQSARHERPIANPSLGF
jgi:hypothetical protein